MTPRMWMAIPAGALVVALAASVQPEAAPSVLPRGTSETSMGEPSVVNEEGVTVVRERGADGKPNRTSVVGWDRVREVTGPLAGEWKKFAPVADKAWRGRSRLERGDWIAAEPLFEELFGQYRSRTGPTALAVSGGLFRCRLARGAQTAAVEPWVAWVRSGGMTIAAGGPISEWMSDSVGSEVSKLLDAGTGLAPDLPPMWLSTAAVQALARTETSVIDPASKPSAAEVRANSFLTLYVLAAKLDSNLTVELPDRAGATADPGVRLVYDIVKSRAGDATQRRDARRALEERLEGKTHGWMESWCRVAVGRSLLMEQGAEERRLGLASLAFVASRTTSAEAYLTGLALAEMAIALSRDGDETSATALAHEMVDRFPGHPALESPAMAKWTVARTSSKPAAGTPDGKKGDPKP